MNDDLLDALDAPMAEAWIAQEGDKLVGTITNLSSRDGGFGEYPILTVEVESATEGGVPVPVPSTLAVHAMSTVQKNELWIEGEEGRWKARVGDTVAMKFLGKKQGRAGNEYSAWRVILQRPSLDAQLDTEPTGLFTN